MNRFGCLITLAVLVSLSSADELLMVKKPNGIHLSQLSEEDHHLTNSEVPHFITYLMGFTTEWNRQLKGVSVDLFSVPKANLLVNIHKPSEVEMNFDNILTYKVENLLHEAVTLQETNEAIEKFHGSKSIILDLESQGQDISLHTQQKPMFNGLPTTVMQMKKHLNDSDFKHDGFNHDEEIDFMFISEVEMLREILTKMNANKEVINDESQDSFLISLTSLDKLANKYGSNSSKVIKAAELLEDFVSVFINKMSQLYHDKLLVEVQLSGPVKHHFDEVVKRRMRRSATWSSPSNYKALNDPDHAVTLNIVVWISILLAISVTAISYGIWFMDPGLDSVIYRMTNHRMKTE